MFFLKSKQATTPLFSSKDTFSSPTDIKESLIKAVEEGNAATVKSLLRSSKDLDLNSIRSGENKLGLLHIAASNGNEKVLNLLFKAKGQLNPNLGDGVNATPLMYAAAKGNTSAIYILSAKGADVNARDEYGYTALHTALKGEKTEAAEALLVLRADPNIRNNAGKTAFHTVCAGGCIRSIQLLIEKNVRPSRDNNNLPPIFEAVNAMRVDVFSLLLTVLSANILDIKDSQGRNLIHIICGIPDRSSLEFMDALIKAFGRDEVCARINAVDNNNRTALHYAVLEGTPLKLVKLLVTELDIARDVVDSTNKTAIMLAVSRPIVVKFLRRANCKCPRSLDKEMGLRS